MVERLVANGWKVFAADINKESLRSSMHDPDVLPVVVDVIKTGLKVSPHSQLNAQGPAGGPFTPSSL